MKKAIMYGGGNIGRGFIGQLLSQSNFEVTFIDVNKELVEYINEQNAYPIKIVSNEGSKEIIIKNVRAVNGLEIENVSTEISKADIMATAVGVNILPRIAKPIAEGLKKRWNNGNMTPFNIIICENLIDANLYLAGLIKEELDKEQKKKFDTLIGMVEASIGRMVPVMTTEMQEGNIAKVWVEEYDKLPVDKAAFKGEIPEIKNLIPFTPFEFYIQRKLFIHNMGHAMTAYLGFLKGYTFIWEAIEDEDIRHNVRAAMSESAKALSIEHNVEISTVLEHVEDLIKRFGNKQLGDTIERVGRDLNRKLSPNDRMIGALNLCIKNKLSYKYIIIGIAAALKFKDPAGSKVNEILQKGGVENVLATLCGLEKGSKLMEAIISRM